MPHPPDSLFGKKKDCVKIMPEAWRLSQTNSGDIEIEVPPSRLAAANLVEQQSKHSNINTDANTGAKFRGTIKNSNTKFSTNFSTADIQDPKDHNADAPSKAASTDNNIHSLDLAYDSMKLCELDSTEDEYREEVKLAIRMSKEQSSLPPLPPAVTCYHICPAS